MRLTSIARLELPAGAIRSYGVRLTTTGVTQSELPVSFDQARHVGLGDRAGSWMAIALRVPHVSPDRFARAWDALVRRHGTLATVFSRADDGAVRLHAAAVTAGDWAEHPRETGEPPRAVVRAVFDRFCRPFAAGSHRLVLVEPATNDIDRRATVVIGADHAHVDMWSLVVLARDLAAELRGEAPAPPVAAFVEHTADLAARAPAPAAVQQAWDEVMDAGGGDLPAFPLPLGDLSRPHPGVIEVRDVLDASGARRLGDRASAAGVRPTALGLSALAATTMRLSGRPLRAVFPVHSRTDERWVESVGWFITNAVIECDDTSPAACAAALKRALMLGSYPLQPIFAPRGGMPATPGMFAVSWLDLRRLPVSAPEGSDAHWVTAAIDTDGVMIWFVIDDSGLHLRCRYPDTPEARISVGGWLDALLADMRAAAA